MGDLRVRRTGKHNGVRYSLESGAKKPKSQKKKKIHIEGGSLLQQPLGPATVWKLCAHIATCSTGQQKGPPDKARHLGGSEPGNTESNRVQTV